MSLLPDSEIRMIVASFVSTQYERVTEGQTDGRTDGHTDRHGRGIYSGCTASSADRCKNG